MAMSDDEYKKLLEERKTQINSELAELQERYSKAHIITVDLESRIKALEIERNNIDTQLSSYTTRPVFSELSDARMQKRDEKYNNLQTQKAVHEAEITNLNAMKAGTTSRYLKRKIDKRVEKIRAKIEKINKKGAKIQGKQRRALYSKLRKVNRRQRIVNREWGRYQTYQERKVANEQLRDSLSDGNFFGRTAKKMYDIKAKFYQRRENRAAEVLTEMRDKNSIIGLRGARVTSMSKKAVSRIRTRLEERRARSGPEPEAAMSM